MKIHQVSVFLENRPGQVLEPCRQLARAGIDLRMMTLADTEKFGILRMIVSDWQRAEAVLREAGYVVRITQVLAVEVPDRPGGLVHLLEVLENSPVNIEYLYAFSFERDGKAILIIRFDDVDMAIHTLQQANLNVLESIDVYRRIAQ